MNKNKKIKLFGLIGGLMLIFIVIILSSNFSNNDISENVIDNTLDNNELVNNYLNIEPDQSSNLTNNKKDKDIICENLDCYLLNLKSCI